jgi:hypothetical protein
MRSGLGAAGGGPPPGACPRAGKALQPVRYFGRQGLAALCNAGGVGARWRGPRSAQAPSWSAAARNVRTWLE